MEAGDVLCLLFLFVLRGLGLFCGFLRAGFFHAPPHDHDYHNDDHCKQDQRRQGLGQIQDEALEAAAAFPTR